MKKLLFSFSILVSSLFADKISIIEVPSMHCPLCTTAVKKAIKSVDGVKKVSVKLNTKSATVIYDDSVKIDTILKAVKTTSYEGFEKSTDEFKAN